MLGWLRLLTDTYLGLTEDDGWAIASHIALSILTSLFPFLIFVTALAGFLGSQELADEAAHLLVETWPEQVAAPIAAEIHNVLTHTRSGLLTIGVVLAIYFSSSAVEALRVGLNRAYDVKEMRPWWWLRIESIFYVLLGAIGLLTLAFLVVLATSL
jgi:membrane protein